MTCLPISVYLTSLTKSRSSRLLLQTSSQEIEDEKEHQETLANNYKRAQQKQAEEIADLKVNLEHIQSRNSELERKQKRFDQVRSLTKLIC